MSYWVLGGVLLVAALLWLFLDCEDYDGDEDL